jgi:hypothetical protein
MEAALRRLMRQCPGPPLTIVPSSLDDLDWFRGSTSTVRSFTTERGWAGNHRREAQSGERPPAQGGQVRKWQMNLKGTGGVCIVISRMRHHDAERSARAMASPAEGLRWLTGAVSSWRVEHRASHARGPGAQSASELEARVLFSRGEGTNRERRFGVCAGCLRLGSRDCCSSMLPAKRRRKPYDDSGWERHRPG